MTRQDIIELIVILLCVNCATFVFVRSAFGTADEFAAKIEPLKGSFPESNTLTYLVAGNLNQPEAAFEFLRPELEGLVLAANFRLVGWSAKATARQIAYDIREVAPKEVKLYTISLGDHVARYVEDYLSEWLYDENVKTELEVIAINPCTTVDFMIPPLGTLLKIGAPIFEVACHALGWLSVISIIPTVGGRYSLILLADQYWSIAYDRPPQRIAHTIGVVCSNPNVRTQGDPEGNDGLLDNNKILDYFDGVPAAMIQTGHGDTVGSAEKYLKAVRFLTS